MTDKEPKRQKFVSLRKALQELKINEEILNKMVDKGYINPIYEGDKAKFKEDEIFNVSRHIHASGQNAFLSIDDEDLYKSSVGAYDSLFLTGTHEVMSAQQASVIPPPKDDSQGFTDTIKTKKIAKQMQMSGHIVKEADMNSPQIDIPTPRGIAKRSVTLLKFDFTNVIEKLQAIPTIWFAIIAILGLIIAAWNIFKTSSPVLIQKVTISKIESFAFEPRLIVEGKVFAQKQISVYAGIQGEITKIFYHSQGAFVNKGDILAEIGNFAFEMELQAAQERLTKAKLQMLEANLALQRASKKLSAGEMKIYARFKKELNLSKRQALKVKTTNQIVESKNKDLYNLCMIELRYQLALQDLQLAKKNSQKCEYQKRFLTVKAPASGILIKIDMALHRRVNFESKLATIVNPLQKSIKAEISGKYALAEGNAAQVILSTGKVFSGKLLSISSAVREPRTALFQIAGNLKDVPWGAKALVKIALPPQKNIIQIPKSCVVHIKESMPVVFWATQEGKNLYRIHSVSVKLGLENEDYYEVKDGLSGGELLVTGYNRGMRFLHDDMAVTAEEPDEF